MLKKMMFMFLLFSFNLPAASTNSSGLAPHLLTPCSSVKVKKDLLCSKTVLGKHEKIDDFSATEDLFEKLDAKAISYDASEISSSIQTIRCELKKGIMQLQKCIDPKLINKQKSTAQSQFVEDLF